MVSHPETGSDSPIGLNRDRGRDKFSGISGTLLFSELFGDLCDMSNQIAEDLIICASHSLYRSNPIPRPLIGVSSSILQDFICLVRSFLHYAPPVKASITILVASLRPL